MGNTNFEKFLTETSWFWSEELVGKQNEQGLVNELLSISSLIQQTLLNSSVTSLIDSLKNLKYEDENRVPRSLILKSLMILLDVSAEILDRVGLYCYHNGISELNTSNGTFNLKKFGPDFNKGLSNENIYKLANTDEDFFEDVLTFMLYAYNSQEFSKYITFANFKLATLVGNPTALTNFYLNRTIENSSQIKQLRAVVFGNSLQTNVKNQILDALNIYGVQEAPANRYVDGKQFDLVLCKPEENLPPEQWKWVIMEVAFQETTNSVIERKASQAQLIYRTLEETNHKLVYLIDGAGFVKRHKVTSTIYENTHFTTTANPAYFNGLIDFLIEYFSY
ncbi:hypothetical protein [Lysinibacillus sphaericus]|uniref:hypothetical protein n=1 Tax=Lysinibacillus sphaericus TaxID=1421 RepID=UPI001CBCA0E0|nr:hypothetical protein [Lysinibacillus sphaericus]